MLRVHNFRISRECWEVPQVGTHHFFCVYVDGRRSYRTRVFLRALDRAARTERKMGYGHVSVSVEFQN